MAKTRKNSNFDESIHEKEAPAHKLRREQKRQLADLATRTFDEDEDWEAVEEITTFDVIRKTKTRS